MDEVLEMKQSGEMERRRDKAQGVITEIEALVPAVQAALKKSRFGKDAVQKAEGVMARARAAIDAGDLHQLAAIEEQLDRTLQLFKAWPGARPRRPERRSAWPASPSSSTRASRPSPRAHADAERHWREALELDPENERVRAT